MVSPAYWSIANVVVLINSFQCWWGTHKTGKSNFKNSYSRCDWKKSKILQTLLTDDVVVDKFWSVFWLFAPPSFLQNRFWTISKEFLLDTWERLKSYWKSLRKFGKANARVFNKERDDTELDFNWDSWTQYWGFERIKYFALNLAGRFIVFKIGKFLMKQSECIDDLILLHFVT